MMNRYLFDIERISYGTIVIQADECPTEEEIRQAIIDQPISVGHQMLGTRSNVNWHNSEYTKVDLGSEYQEIPRQTCVSIDYPNNCHQCDDSTMCNPGGQTHG